MRTLLISLSLASTFAMGSAHGEATPEVTGTLEVNGDKIPVKQVYALQHDNEEGLLDGPELRLLLVDREVNPDLLGGLILSALDDMARAKQVRGLIIRFDPKKDPREVHETLLVAPESAQATLPFMTSSGSETSIKKLEIKDGKVSGVVESKSADDSIFPDMPKYSYHLTFTAPIRSTPPITAKLKGAEALASPQAKLVLAFEKAVRDGDFDAARKLAVDSRMHELDQMVQQVGKAAFLEQAKQMIPENAVHAKQLTDVVVRGKHGFVIFKEEGSRTPVPVIESGGTWKVE